MSEEDEWVKSAVYNDSMVIEQLIRLKQEDNNHLMMKQQEEQPVLLLQWGVKQPRSRQILRYEDVGKGKKVIDDELTRASPTTPLSWSGGTSNNSGCAGGGGGDEESSVRLCNARSKVSNKFNKLCFVVVLFCLSRCMLIGIGQLVISF